MDEARSTELIDEVMNGGCASKLPHLAGINYADGLVHLTANSNELQKMLFIGRERRQVIGRCIGEREL